MRGLSAFRALCVAILGFSLSGCGEDRVTFSELTSAFGVATEKQALSDESFVATFHPKSPDLENAKFTVVVGFNRANQCLSFSVHSEMSGVGGFSSKDWAAFHSFTWSLAGKTLFHCYATFNEDSLLAFSRPSEKTHTAS